jgi:putative heme-binding domain-containing protein
VARRLTGARRRLLGTLSAALIGICPMLRAQEAADTIHAQPTATARSQQATADGAAVERGRALFEGKGACQSCHRVNGIGSRIAPDLTSSGSILSAEAMSKTLTDPNAALRPGVRSVRGVTRDGKVVVGMRLNEDMYTVQLIDDQEHLRSLTKKDLREYAILTTARMPSYREKLTASEIADVVSYLRSLKNP